MAAAAIQPPGFQYFLNPQQQAPHQQPIQQQPIQQGGQHMAQQHPQQPRQVLQQLPQPPNEIPEYIFNLRLSTLQSSHRATFSPTDNRAIHNFLATDPVFLTFSTRFPVTVTQLRNRGFDFSTLRALLGYAQVGNATTFDGIPILPMLDQKVLSKIEREYHNMDFDENNEEVTNSSSVIATNSRLPSVVINNNHHFLGSGEQNIGVSSVSPNASGMNATVPRAPVAISNSQPQPVPLTGRFAVGNPIQAANGAAQIEVPAVQQAAAPVAQQAAAQVQVPGLQAPQPAAQLSGPQQYAAQGGAQNPLQQQANEQQANQQAGHQQHQQAAQPAVQNVPQQQFNHQRNQNIAQQQARQQQVPQAQNHHGVGQNFSQNHQQQHHDQEQAGQQADNLFQQGRPIGAQPNQNESQQQPIGQQDPYPAQQQEVQQVAQDVLQQRDAQPIRQRTQQHPNQQATYPALPVQPAQSPSRRLSYAASSPRQRADSSDDEGSMDAQPIAGPPAGTHRNRSRSRSRSRSIIEEVQQRNQFDTMELHDLIRAYREVKKRSAAQGLHNNRQSENNYGNGGNQGTGSRGARLPTPAMSDIPEEDEVEGVQYGRGRDYY